MDIVGFLKSQFICHLLICYIFIVSGLIINFIQLFTLILWPINKQLFRRINCRLAYCISSRKILFCFLFYFFFKLLSYFVLRESLKKIIWNRFQSNLYKDHDCFLQPLHLCEEVYALFECAVLLKCCALLLGYLLDSG